jgi:hypothetical protein
VRTPEALDKTHDLIQGQFELSTWSTKMVPVDMGFIFLQKGLSPLDFSLTHVGLRTSLVSRGVVNLRQGLPG